MNRSNNHFPLLLVGLALGLSIASGCSKKSPWEIPYPTQGEVTLKGKPVPNAELVLHPIDDKCPQSVRPQARTSSNGTFQAWTYREGDGVPEGRYKITVIRNEVAVSKGTIVAKPNDLPRRYASKDTTDLEVTILAGNNVLPRLELR